MPSLGIAFTIPDGWVGQLGEEAYIIASNTEPGIVLMSVNEYRSLEELRSEAVAGLQDANGTSLMLSGELIELTANALGGEFEGTIEWQQAKAFIAGVINPIGQGVTVMVATNEANYSQRYVDLAKEIVESLEFSEIEKLPIADEWKQTLNDSKLTYMDSYYSSGSSVGGYSTGGGYSSEEEIHLCSAGFFRFSSSNSMSFDTGGGFGSSYGSDQGDGSWDVISTPAGEAVLQLHFRNGEISEYTLTYEDNKTYLNGYRYFRTYASEGADFAPNCY